MTIDEIEIAVNARLNWKDKMRNYCKLCTKDESFRKELANFLYDSREKLGLSTSEWVELTRLLRINTN
jgi:hypothetical protein